MTLDAELQRILDALREADGPPAHEVPVELARAAHLAETAHLAEASGVAIDVRTDAFDVPEPLQAVAAATGADPYDLLLAGGEDHALAATFTADAVPEGWRVVGSVSSADAGGETGVLVDGTPWESTGGFDHFGRSR